MEKRLTYYPDEGEDRGEIVGLHTQILNKRLRCHDVIHDKVFV